MWDDFHPYVYMTSDSGAHWTTLTTGLPADQYVFAIRQDPREPRLLFAGTRSTAYVSIDGGAGWQPLTLNLPGVQVRDIAIDARQGEVAVATHGRAIWILDNLALLEQLARDRPAGATADLRLFAPETAWLSHSYGTSSVPIPDTGKNPEYGATIFFKLPASYDGKTAVRLTFRDVRGNLIRTFALHRKARHEKPIPPEVRYEFGADQLRALSIAELTAVAPGMNRFLWDLRYPPATEVTGFKEPTADNFSTSVDGPTIVPGAYRVELQYGKQTLTQPLRLQLDPRLTATPNELDARLALERNVHDTLNKLDTSINAAMVASRHLPPAQRARIRRAIDELVLLDVHSSEGDVLHETKLREHLAFLANELETAYQQPTAAEYAAFDEFRARALRGETRLTSALSVR
jgi:hypothetical protein